MKKTILSMCAAFVAAVFMISCGGNTKAEGTNDSTQVEAEAQADEATDINAATADLVKKFDAGEQLTDQDFGVAIDYASAMAKEMLEFTKANAGSDNVDGLLDIMKKYEYADKIDKILEGVRASDIKDEAVQQKWAEYMKLSQEMD